LFRVLAGVGRLELAALVAVVAADTLPHNLRN